jgi:hypothetical protein
MDHNGKKKVLDERVPQSDTFLNYEAAINAVFMQVKKYNPLIGAKYWLSPFGVHDTQVDVLSELRNQFGILTPLTILARLVNVNLYGESNDDKQIDINYFRKIAETQLRLCKEKEQENMVER